MKNSSEYPVENAPVPYKRICLALDLKNDADLIAKYKYYHARENNWPEINEGIRISGIKVMDIYCVDNRMFMICELEADANFTDCWKKMGTYSKQDEWAELMAKFQQALPGHELEWVVMERVYSLPKA